MGWPNPSLTRWVHRATRPIVEDGLRLTVHKVVKAFGSRPFTKASGSWCWTYAGEASPHSQIGCEGMLLDDGRGVLTLDYKRNGVPMRQAFALEGVPCRFGGRKWYALCPATGKRASTLYSLGSRGFQSRYVYRPAYRCQNEGHMFDRAIRQRNKILDRLGSDDVDFQPKPKRMRWKTYARLQARRQRLQAACYAGMAMHLRSWGSDIDPDLMDRAVGDADGALKRHRK